MGGKFKRVEYFDAALEQALEATVMKTLMDKLSAADLDMLHQYSLENWKTVFCTDHQQQIKLETLKLL